MFLKILFKIWIKISNAFIKWTILRFFVHEIQEFDKRQNKWLTLERDFCLSMKPISSRLYGLLHLYLLHNHEVEVNKGCLTFDKSKYLINVLQWNNTSYNIFHCLLQYNYLSSACFIWPGTEIIPLKTIREAPIKAYVLRYSLKK